MIETPVISMFFGNPVWTAPDLDATWIEGWGPDNDGNFHDIANRSWIVEVLDDTNFQVSFHMEYQQQSIAAQPGWTVKVTAREVTDVSDPPDLIRSYGEQSEEAVFVVPGVDPPPTDPTVQIGGYVRHRDRMVQQSVFEDVRDTLIACRWMPGTTSHEVSNPYNGETWEVVTTQQEDVFPLLEDAPIVLIDYFPEAEDNDRGLVGDLESNKTAPNTFALDSGTAGDAVQRELGSTGQFVPYTFNMAFFASSDAVAQAVLNDLRDRYVGRLVRNDAVALYNFNTEDTAPVVWMDVEKFSYRLNTELESPADIHLYFAELLILDEVD